MSNIALDLRNCLCTELSKSRLREVIIFPFAVLWCVHAFACYCERFCLDMYDLVSAPLLPRLIFLLVKKTSLFSMV